MIVKTSGRLFFHLLLLYFPAYFFWSALSYDARARLIPTLVSAVVFALQFAVIAGECRKAVVGRGRSDSEPGEELLIGREVLQVAIIGVWTLLFFFSIYFVGFLPGAFLFFLFFLRACGRTSWFMAVGGATVLVVFIWCLFVKLLRFELFAGVLFGAVTPGF